MSEHFWAPHYGVVLRHRDSGEVVMLLGRDPAGQNPAFAIPVIVKLPDYAERWSLQPGTIATSYPFDTTNWERLEGEDGETGI